MFIDSLVIGSGIESLVYAFINDSYYLSTAMHPPIFTESIDIKFLGSQRKDYHWSRLQIIMALTGRLLSYDSLKSVKIEDDLTKIVSDDKIFKYRFGSCTIFDTTGISLENEIVESNEPEYYVYDDFEISQLGGKHTYLRPKLNDSTEIHYYSSNRVDGAHYVTDCVVKSKMNKRQLNSVEYSDSIFRFIVLRDLSAMGIEGNFMGRYKNGTPKFRKPKVKHKKRIILERDRTKYKDSKFVKFKNMTLKEVFDELGP